MKSKLFALATVLLAAACGGSSPSTSAASPSPSPAATGEKIAVATNAKLGSILVDEKGMTVYLFVADTTKESTCYTSCAAIWPPVLTDGAPQAGTGAQASLLGTTTRTDGKVEVTYAGHPLYLYKSATERGETSYVGVTSFGGTWDAVNAAGGLVK